MTANILLTLEYYNLRNVWRK